ncbi:zinc metalloproteinase nas-13 [Caerostris darwini]|uniref:Metalloendopeptidase n=1 Tax=Caerostris darwini TaxID=1538125 RepID=A0AAV4WT17_9ARAC|nr:zinc metalloproteinase nas-13 [Caerostris darwini]
MLGVLTTCITPVGTTTAESKTGTLGVTISDVTANVKSRTDPPVVTFAPTIGVTTGMSETGMLEILTSGITTVGITTTNSKTSTLGITPSDVTANIMRTTKSEEKECCAKTVKSKTDTSLVTSTPTVGVTTIKSTTGMLSVLTSGITTVGITTGNRKSRTLGIITTDVTANTIKSTKSEENECCGDDETCETDTSGVTSAPTIGVTTGMLGILTSGISTVESTTVKSKTSSLLMTTSDDFASRKTTTKSEEKECCDDNPMRKTDVLEVTSAATTVPGFTTSGHVDCAHNIPAETTTGVADDASVSSLTNLDCAKCTKSATFKTNLPSPTPLTNEIDASLLSTFNSVTFTPSSVSISDSSDITKLVSIGPATSTLEMTSTKPTSLGKNSEFSSPITVTSGSVNTVNPEIKTSRKMFTSVEEPKLTTTGTVKCPHKKPKPASKSLISFRSKEFRNFTTPYPPSEHSVMYHRTQIFRPFEGRTALRDPETLWVGGIIPYELSDNYDAKQKGYIREGMDEFEKKTCIKFVPKKEEKTYIKIKPDTICASPVGRIVGRPSKVTLSDGCYSQGVILHELMHLLGFVHEQNRPDRDQYVMINWDNIQEGKENNFRKLSEMRVTTLDVGYDYNSLMHYSSYEFAKDDDRPTITPLKPGVTVGNKEYFSDKDLLKIKKLYNCQDSKRGKEAESSAATSSMHGSTLSARVPASSSSFEEIQAEQIKSNINYDKREEYLKKMFHFEQILFSHTLNNEQNIA